MKLLYLKQALQSLRQNRFITVISIVGTALAIMMATVVIVVYNVENADIAPESRRSETYYYSMQVWNRKEGEWQRSYSVKFDDVRNLFSKLKDVEYVSAYDNSYITYNDPSSVKTDYMKTSMNLYPTYTDHNYWNILSFDFLYGAPFTEEDFTAGNRNIVISEATAKKVFGSVDVIGKTIDFDQREYRVCGVVKDIARSLHVAYSDAWMPYTTHPNPDLLDFDVMFIPEKKGGLESVVEQVEAYEREILALDPDWSSMHFTGRFSWLDNEYGPGDKYYDQIQLFGDISYGKRWLYYIALFSSVFFLLLVPSLNLTGFSMAQIRQRVEEIGIRKAFGATRKNIIYQILTENLLISLIGGAIGLILSIATVLCMHNWLLGVESFKTVPLKAILSPAVFLWVLVFVFAVNLLSNGIPALKASKMQVSESLNRNNFRS